MAETRQATNDDRQHRQLVDRVRASIEASRTLVENLERAPAASKPSKE
jgi:hypothetical protein